MTASCPARVTSAPCRQHPNPRYQDGFCWHCHKQLSVSTRRDLSFERELTHLASGLDPAVDIIRVSEARCEAAHGHYTKDLMDIAPGRDLRQDTLEELADARSYLCFYAQERRDDPWVQEQVKFALGAVVRAFNALLVHADY